VGEGDYNFVVCGNVGMVVTLLCVRGGGVYVGKVV